MFGPITPWGLVPLYVKVLLILGLCVGAVAGWEGFLHHQRSIGAAAALQDKKIADQKATIAQMKLDDAETQRRLDAQRKNQNAQNQELEAARLGRDRALSAYSSLSNDLDRYVRDNAGACNPAAIGNGKATGSPCSVLADMLRRSREDYRQLALFTDASRIAGLKCERDYDSLSKGVTK